VDVDGGREEVGLEDSRKEVVSDGLVVEVLCEQVEDLRKERDKKSRGEV